LAWAVPNNQTECPNGAQAEQVAMSAFDGPPPHIEALCCRLLLGVDDSDTFLFDKALTDAMACPECAQAVILSLTVTVKHLFDHGANRRRWRKQMERRLLNLLDYIKKEKERHDAQ
jgi:hypothetical protein